MIHPTSFKKQTQRLALSVLLHGLVLGLLMSLPAGMPDKELGEEAIEVEFVPVIRPPLQTYAPPAEKQAEKTVPTEMAAEQPQDDPERAVEIDQDGFVHPGKMLSANILAMTHNRKARRALGEIGREEKWEQICMLEAMEQISAFDVDLTPDLLHSYTFELPDWKGKRQIADGAAFFAGGQWYRLAYMCELAKGADEVIDFSFRIGESVPRDDWESLNLVAEVMETVQGIERYNDGTRGEGFKPVE